jgi:hypothetical protein
LKSVYKTKIDNRKLSKNIMANSSKESCEFSYRLIDLVKHIKLASSNWAKMFKQMKHSVPETKSEFELYVIYRRELNVLLEQINKFDVPSEIKQIIDIEYELGFVEYSDMDEGTYREKRDKLKSLKEQLSPEMNNLLFIINKQYHFKNRLDHANDIICIIYGSHKKNPKYLYDLKRLDALRKKCIHDGLDTTNIPSDIEYFFASYGDCSHEAFVNIQNKFMTNNVLNTLVEQPFEDTHWSKCPSCYLKMSTIDTANTDFFCELHL